MAARSLLSHGDYTVGWICALPLEMAAAKLLLDSIHPSLPRPPKDQNTYILGNIGDHKIVIACLPIGAYGNVSAATVAMQLLSTFHSIRFGLMVSIGGGVPTSNADIRLGDIVVSQPADTSGGVIQYDLGKALSGGQFQRIGMLNRPPKVLLTALATLQAHHFTADSRVFEFISEIQAKIKSRTAANFARPTKGDFLYQTEYDHRASATCVDCDKSKLILRPSRDHEEPVIHYGLVASGNQVVKDGKQRDQLAQELGNKEWQGYAAAVAAAYAKDLVLMVPIDQIETTPTARNTLADSVHRFNIPLDLTAVPVIEEFIGRQNELDNLWQYLQPTNSSSRKVAILHGLKNTASDSLRARSFALNRLPGQGWDREATNEGEVEQRARHMLRWLALEGNSRWLIIFDNIDQYSPFNSAADKGYDIAEFFPKADHRSILITSRLQTLSELGKSFPAHRLDSHNSIALLLQSSGLLARNTTSKFDVNPDLLTLTNRLDGLPLAIVIAGAFMRETGTSITKYLQYYQEAWSKLQRQSNPGRQYQQGNMLQTWMISYREIQRRDPRAADLLLLLACFDNRDIWFELLENASNSSEVPDWLERAISSELGFRDCVRPLIEFSLVYTKQQKGSYAMHPVVQDWCVHIASTDKSVDSLQLDELALVCVGYSVPNASERDYTRLEQRLIPHAIAVRNRQYSADNLSILGGFHGLGNLYSDKGKVKEAEEMYQRALAGYEKALGPDHTSTLITVNNLGNLYSNQGKLKEAEEMYQRALAGYEKAFGPDHTSTLDSVNNLGSLYSDQGKLKEAEEIYQPALPNNEKVAHLNASTARRAIKKFALLFK
ncbi:hypothetical protein N7537_011400 [Penicillium hordei]|uniref:Nucleoside phosphorylase domain-containing protein n=1 Tax=Penicillium hordei TaxID=40994 RepID=A0AAD6GTK1_9EURO|nr:uncharacterized protein N7537_011400 [Penicillium hordei]KAJ5588722.1 hypothetical protein N7537_011400 [Penicillium hordei]